MCFEGFTIFLPHCSWFLVSIVAGKDAWYDFNFLHQDLFCSLVCDLSSRMFHVDLKRMCILLLSDGILLPNKSLWSNVSFKGSASLLIFCPDDLSIDVTEVFKFSIIVLLSISPFLSINIWYMYFRQFSHSIVSNSLQPHEPQHTRPPCLSPTSGAYPNSCPLSLWRPPTISSCRPLFLLPPIPPSIRVFSNESVLRIRWPKYQRFTFSISPSSEYSGLISFRVHWLDLLAVQGTLKSLLQHHSSKESILQYSALFKVQLSHPYMLLLLLSHVSRVRLCATP